MFKILQQEQRIKTLEKRVSDLEIKLNEANSIIFNIAADHKILRDKVLRKIQFKKQEEGGKEEQPLPEYPLFT